MRKNCHSISQAPSDDTQADAFQVCAAGDADDGDAKDSQDDDGAEVQAQGGVCEDAQFCDDDQEEDGADVQGDLQDAQSEGKEDDDESQVDDCAAEEGDKE